MAAKIMYASCPAVSGITKIAIDESYDAACARCVVIGTDMAKTPGGVDSVELGEIVQVRAGTLDRNNLVFTGVMTDVEKDAYAHETQITLMDMYIRAVDSYKLPYPSADGYNLVFNGWAAEALVADQLNNYALLGNMIADQSSHNPTTSGARPYTPFDYFSSNFRFSIVNQDNINSADTGIKVKLMTVAQFVDQIATMLDYKCWADYRGGIHFRPRPVYPAPGDPRGATDSDNSVPSFLSFSSNNRPLALRYHKSRDNMRNQVLVKGNGDILYMAEDQAPSGSTGRPIDPVSGRAYTSLVDGSSQTFHRNFPRGAFLDDNWLFSTQTQDQILSNPDGDNNPVVKAARYNLNALLRPTETATLKMFGDSRVHALYSNDGTDGGIVPSIVNIETFGLVTGDYVPELRSKTWFVHSCHHEWSQSGYFQTLTLTR